MGEDVAGAQAAKSPRRDAIRIKFRFMRLKHYVIESRVFCSEGISYGTSNFPIVKEIAHLHCTTPFGQAVRRKCRQAEAFLAMTDSFLQSIDLAILFREIADVGFRSDL